MNCFDDGTWIGFIEWIDSWSIIGIILKNLSEVIDNSCYHQFICQTFLTNIDRFYKDEGGMEGYYQSQILAMHFWKTNKSFFLSYDDFKRHWFCYFGWYTILVAFDRYHDLRDWTIISKSFFITDWNLLQPILMHCSSWFHLSSHHGCVPHLSICMKSCKGSMK